MKRGKEGASKNMTQMIADKRGRKGILKGGKDGNQRTIDEGGREVLKKNKGWGNSKNFLFKNRRCT